MGPVLGEELPEDPEISDADLVAMLETAADEASLSIADAYWSGDWKQPSLEQIKRAIRAGRSFCEDNLSVISGLQGMDAAQRRRVTLVVDRFGHGLSGLRLWVDEFASTGKADAPEDVHLAYCDDVEALAAWVRTGSAAWRNP